MRIFITGATGAVGAPVAKRLKERGHEIVALVRSHESATRVVA
jgi:nucleoside-diphosphate-sugar epimerase